MAIREIAALAPIPISFRASGVGGSEHDSKHFADRIGAELSEMRRAITLVADWVEHRHLAITASYSIVDETAIFADATLAPVVVTLPASDTNAFNRDVHVKKTDATANAVTLTPQPGDTIDGMASIAIITEGQSFHLIADGLGLWRVLSSVAASGGGGLVSPATAAPVIVNFTAAAVGVSVKYAREDHRHLLDRTIVATAGNAWTGSHAWSPSADAVPITINAPATARMFVTDPADGDNTVIDNLGHLGVGEPTPTAMVSIKARVGLIDPFSLTPDLWIDAQNAACFSSPPADTDPLQNLLDLTANNRDFTREGGAPGPTDSPKYRTTTYDINGLPAINFDGDLDDTMKYPTEVAYAGAYTVGFVFLADSGGSFLRSFNAVGRFFGASAYGFQFPSAYTPAAINVFYAASSFAMTGSVSLTPGAAYYCVIRRDGSNVHRIWLNGVEVTLGSPLTQAGTLIVSRLFGLSDDGGAIANPTNSIGELIIFASSLAEADVDDLNVYLNAHWAFGGASGSSFPLTDWKDSAGVIDSIVDESINFGLGTAAPTFKLHVIGAIAIAATDGGFTTSFINGTQAGNIAYTLPAANVTAGLLKNDGVGVLSWNTAATLGLVSGTGTLNKHARWTSASTIGDGLDSDDGTTWEVEAADTANREGAYGWAFGGEDVSQAWPGGFLLKGGDRLAAGFEGGSIAGLAGTGGGTDAGGSIYFKSGACGTNAEVQFQMFGATSGAGGSVNLASGAAGGASGAGGSFDFSAGAGGATVGSGGLFNMTAGDALGDGFGGDFILRAGDTAGGGGSSGGRVFIYAGDASVGGDGGSIELNIGAGAGGGADGTFAVVSPSNQYAYHDLSLLTGFRTFTFPDASGTIALTSDLAAYQPLDTDLTEIAAVANVRGDLLLTDSGPVWRRLAIGAANTVLFSDGTDAAWGVGFTPTWTAVHTFSAQDVHNAGVSLGTSGALTRTALAAGGGVNLQVTPSWTAGTATAGDVGLLIKPNQVMAVNTAIMQIQNSAGSLLFDLRRLGTLGGGGAGNTRYRFGYDSANYYEMQISSAGTVTAGSIGAFSFGATAGDITFTSAAGAVKFAAVGNLALNIVSNVSAVFADGMVISPAGNTTGLKIGGAGDKLGLYSVAPVIQPVGALQAAITNSTGGTQDGTLVDVTTLGIADPAKINDNFTDIFALLDAIRTGLVNLGAIKGSA